MICEGKKPGRGYSGLLLFPLLYLPFWHFTVSQPKLMEFTLKLFCYLLATLGKKLVEETFEVNDLNKNVRLYGFNLIILSLTSLIRDSHGACHGLRGL